MLTKISTNNYIMDNDKKVEVKNKRFIKNLEKHIDNTNQNLKYSLDRFDILIISLSSGGLIFSMGFVKDILSSDTEINYILLKISWILFGGSIISNLLSQVTGYFANSLEIKISKNIIRQERGKSFKGDQNKFEKNHRRYNSLTKYLNGSSLTFLIGAVILLIIFVSINLN